MTYGSLFSGIGGIDLGLDRAGWQCKWQVEIDEYCRKILAKHWPEVPKFADIKAITGEELETVDLICGGFPCQDLSQAGKRAGIEGTRSGLWFEFARLIGVLRPRYVLIENVPGLLDHRAMPRVIGELARLGYVGCWTSLRAAEFGAAHLRKRVFIVAHDSINVGRRESISLRGRTIPTSDCTNSSSLVHASRTTALAHSTSPSGGGNSKRAERGAGGPDLKESVEKWKTPHGMSNRDHKGKVGGFCGGEFAKQANHWGTPNSHPRTHDPREVDSGIQLANQARMFPTPSARDYRTPNKKSYQERGGADEGRAASELCGALPSFAPGPSDPRWPAILRDYPDLAPAIATARRGAGSGEAETEPEICGMADGLSAELDRAMSNRTKRLSRLGNAVVPQCAEYIGRLILACDPKS